MTTAKFSLASIATAVTAAVLSTTVMAADDWPQSLTISTASPGGVYAIYGEGMARILSDEVGINTSTRQTQGPAQNLILLQSGQAPIAMTTSAPAWEAIHGELELLSGQSYEGVRALFAMYPTPFQMIAPADSGISSISDFNGKRLGAGPRAGTGGTYWTRWLNEMDIEVKLQYGGIGDQASQLADGRLDAIVTAGGVPHPSFSELENTQDVTIFGMSDEERQQLLEANPYAVDFIIPEGTYSSAEGDLKTVAMWNFVVVDEGMSDDLAYEITKAVLENQERLRSTHAAAVDTLAANIEHNTFIPLHPGATRYYEEVGIEIPEALK